MKTLIRKFKSLLKDKGIYCWLDLLPYRYRMLYWETIKPVFKPQHERLRKAIPRTWCDISSLIVTVNFEFIKSFYEEEYKLGQIDWKSSKEHAAFERWLKKAYRYITVERPILNTRLDEAYPPSKPFDEMFVTFTDETGRKVHQMVDDGVPYKVKYKDVIAIENKISKLDTKVITEMIQYREYFWT